MIFNMQFVGGYIKFIQMVVGYNFPVLSLLFRGRISDILTAVSVPVCSSLVE